MLCHAALGEYAVLSPPPSQPTPYLIAIDDETEIDVMHLVVIEPFVPAELE